MLYHPLFLLLFVFDFGVSLYVETRPVSAVKKEIKSVTTTLILQFQTVTWTIISCHACGFSCAASTLHERIAYMIACLRIKTCIRLPEK